MGSKGNKVQSTQTYTPNPAIAAAGTQALTGAQAAAQLPFQQPVAPVAGFSPYQEQAFNQIQQLQGAVQPYFDQAQQYMQASAVPVTGQEIAQNVGGYYNPFAQNVFSNLQDIYGMQQKQATMADTAQAGGVGADRIGVAQANLAKQQQLAAGQTAASLYQPAMQAAQQSALQGRQMEAGAGFGIGQLGPAAQNAYLQATSALGSAGAQQQALSQAQQNAQYQNILSQIALPYQQPQYLAGITGGLAPAFGGTSNTTTTYPTPSALSQILGVGTALAGLGGSLGGSLGSLGSLGGGKGSYAGPTGNYMGYTPSYGAPIYGPGFRRGGRLGYDGGGSLPLYGLRDAVPIRPSRPSMPSGLHGDPGARVSETADKISSQLPGGGPVQEYQPLMAAGGFTYGNLAETQGHSAGNPYLSADTDEDKDKSYADGGDVDQPPPLPGATPLPLDTTSVVPKIRTSTSGGGHSGLFPGEAVDHLKMPTQGSTPTAPTGPSTGSTGSSSSSGNNLGAEISAGVNLASKFLPMLLAARGGPVNPYDAGVGFADGGDSGRILFDPSPMNPDKALTPNERVIGGHQEFEKGGYGPAGSMPWDAGRWRRVINSRGDELNAIKAADGGDMDFPDDFNYETAGARTEIMPQMVMRPYSHTGDQSVADTFLPSSGPAQAQAAPVPLQNPMAQPRPEDSAQFAQPVGPVPAPDVTMPRGRPLGAPDVPGNLLDRAGAGVKTIETGSPQGDYQNITTTRNPRTGQIQHALGAYQVMEDELPEWSTAVFGSPVSKQDFLYGPHAKEIQDTIFRQKFGESVQKYGQGDLRRGIELAGREWFGGPGGVTHTDRSDAFGRLTTGGYGQRVLASANPQEGEDITGAPVGGGTTEISGRLKNPYIQANRDLQVDDYLHSPNQPYPDALDRDWGQRMARSPWMSLVKAGAAMAQSTGPIGSVIGKGIAAGAGELESQRSSLASEQQQNQKADTLFAAAKQHLDQYQRMTPYQEATKDWRQTRLETPPARVREARWLAEQRGISESEAYDEIRKSATDDSKRKRLLLDIATKLPEAGGDIKKAEEIYKRDFSEPSPTPSPTVPIKPPGVPDGSGYSPSTKTWFSPDGSQKWDENGKEV